MVDGNDLVAVTPGLQYVHHVHYVASESGHRLPVVGAETVYLLNHTVSKSKYLAAGKREAFQLSLSRAAVFVAKKGAAAEPLRWKAWKDAPMTAVIEAAGTLFSGGTGRVYATAAADGKELWSVAVPGTVEDLAFCEGRLFVQCDGGSVLCFGKRP
jgi:outer membrane protein assembly factor BamB